MSDLEFYDHVAEGHVLGAGILGYVEDVQPGDFHVARYRPVWSLIQQMKAEGKPISLETVIARLDPPNDLHIELAKLATNSATLAAPEYAERIVDLSRRRGLLESMQLAVRKLNAGDTMDSIVSHLTADSLVYAQERIGAEHINASGVIDTYLDAFANPRDTWGIRTGIGAIDHELGGLHPGETFLLAGDPGVGKSIFTSQLGFQMAGIPFWTTQKVDTNPGAMYHLEMTKEAVIRRAACSVGKVDYRSVRTGRLSDGESKRFLDAAGRLSAAPVYISDATHWTTSALRADVARLVSEHGIKWVLVDYAGLLKDPAESEIAREITVSKALHDIAKMGVAVIVVETLNKAGLRGERSLSGVRGSVQKIYDADVVVFLQMPEGNKDIKTPNRELKFTKAREADMFLKIPFILRGAQKRFEPIV